MGKRGGQRFINLYILLGCSGAPLFHLPVFLRNDGRVAQLVEQVTFNHWVTGSNPVALTKSDAGNHRFQRLFCFRIGNAAYIFP